MRIVMDCQVVLWYYNERAGQRPHMLMKAIFNSCVCGVGVSRLPRLRPPLFSACHSLVRIGTI